LRAISETVNDEHEPLSVLETVGDGGGGGGGIAAATAILTLSKQFKHQFTAQILPAEQVEINGPMESPIPEKPGLQSQVCPTAGLQVACGSHGEGTQGLN